MDEIKNAEIEEVKIEEENEESPEEKIRRQKRDWQIELALFLILGILVGVALKTEAVKRITIGFDDYKNKPAGEYYSVNKLQAELEKKNQEEMAKQEEAAGQPVTPEEENVNGEVNQ